MVSIHSVASILPRSDRSACLMGHVATTAFDAPYNNILRILLFFWCFGWTIGCHFETIWLMIHHRLGLILQIGRMYSVLLLLLWCEQFTHDDVFLKPRNMINVSFATISKQVGRAIRWSLPNGQSAMSSLRRRASFLRHRRILKHYLLKYSLYGFLTLRRLHSVGIIQLWLVNLQ